MCPSSPPPDNYDPCKSGRGETWLLPQPCTCVLCTVTSKESCNTRDTNFQLRLLTCHSSVFDVYRVFVNSCLKKNCICGEPQSLVNPPAGAPHDLGNTLLHSYIHAQGEGELGVGCN